MAQKVGKGDHGSERRPPNRAQRTTLEIVGDRRFIRGVRRALKLLKQKTPGTHLVVLRHVGRIEEGEYVHFKVGADPSTVALTKCTAFTNRKTCASALVHEAYHSMLHQLRARGRRRAPPLWESDRVAQEQFCIARELEFLERVNGPPRVIAWLKNQDGTHCLHSPSQE